MIVGTRVNESPTQQARFLAALNALGPTVLDPAVLEAYRGDRAPQHFVQPGVPLAMFTPRSTAEVAEAVRLAGTYSVPIVVRGAGSGLSGGCAAVDGCLVLNMVGMARIMSIDESSMTATVQPGVLNGDLKNAAAVHGLWYAPDPGSVEFSTIGGNVATNAGGLCCAKYGVTRDALLGLEIVLPDASVHRFGRRTRKGVVGYDLPSLICGSEGTLGVITEVTVRLIPRPADPITVAAEFSDLSRAGEAIEAAVRLSPALLEVMDRTTIEAVERLQPMGFGSDAQAVVLAQSDLGGAGGLEQASRLATVLRDGGAEVVVQSDDHAEAATLMHCRRIAYPALEACGQTLLDDVAVPIGRIPELLALMPRVAADHDVTIATFGHAGDGNLHPTIVTPHGDVAAARRAVGAFDRIVRLALDMGGTATGEHGVGRLKYRFLDEELGDGLQWHRKVRRLFDPDQLLSPLAGI